MVDDKHFSPVFKKIVTNYTDDDQVLISAISVWELGMLVEKKRIRVEMDPLDWVQQALDKPGIKLVPLSPRISIESTRLPGEIHCDPADRMLIATAKEESAVLVTCDDKILEYGKGRYISVYDPST
jgi:PIN domain nuclease of toxin-antitoxin system